MHDLTRRSVAALRSSTPAPAGKLRSLPAVAGTSALAIAALAAGCFAPRLAHQHEWVGLHPDAPKQIKQAVLGKKLIQGMPRDAARASWGEPDEELKLGGGVERWTYKRPQSLGGVHVTVEYMLVFDRGILIRIHQQKYR